MEVIIKHFANNEIRLQIQTEAYRPKSFADKTKERKNERHAQAFEDLLAIKKSEPHCIPVEAGIERTLLCDGIQLDLLGAGTLVNPRYSVQTKYNRVLSQLIQLPSGKFTVQQCDYDSLRVAAERRFNITRDFQRRSSKVKGGWGKLAKPTRFGNYARHSVLEAGAVVDQTCPRENTYEVTLTLPGGTDEAIRTLSEWSGWLVNRLLQFVRRHPCSTNIQWFYVWELQKRGALHMHWCISASHGCNVNVKALAQTIEYQWFELLLELKDITGIDMFERRHGGTHRYRPQVWQSHVMQIYKSVAAYYSKYTCKDSANIERERRIKSKRSWSPARWWGSSASVKALIKASRYEARVSFLSPEQASFVYNCVCDYLKEYTIVKSHKYEFTIASEDRSFVFCSGLIHIRYIQPGERDSAFAVLRAIGGSASERIKGETLLQSFARTALEMCPASCSE